MQKIEYGDPGARAVLIQPVDEHDLSVIGNEIENIRKRTEKEFRLIAFRVNDWNTDLSPWKSPAVFGSEGFGDGAGAVLGEILENVRDGTKEYYIGGYSLAGLFALWAAYETGAFSGVAAASPSMWFPEFTEYMNENEIRCGAVYLSLGDKESKTRNPVMATVGDRIREAHGILTGRGVDCILEWNEGNHFRDADVRTAKGFAWLLNRSGKNKEYKQEYK